MHSDVLSNFGLACGPRAAGYFETDALRELSQTLDAAIRAGGLIALCGVAGCGKTALLSHIRDTLRQEARVLVSQSFALENDRVTLETLILALCQDLGVGKPGKIPSEPELRDRRLLSQIAQREYPVLPVIDDAHGIDEALLPGLKRLVELGSVGNGRLSILLAGQPSLRDKLRYEQVRLRTRFLEHDGIEGEQAAYLTWLLGRCMGPDTRIEDILTPEALALLVELLMTPLQIERALSLVLERAYRLREKPVTAERVAFALGARHRTDKSARYARPPTEAGSFLHVSLEAELQFLG